VASTPGVLRCHGTFRDDVALVVVRVLRRLEFGFHKEDVMARLAGVAVFALVLLLSLTHVRSQDAAAQPPQTGPRRVTLKKAEAGPLLIEERGVLYDASKPRQVPLGEITRTVRITFAPTITSNGAVRLDASHETSITPRAAPDGVDPALPFLGLTLIAPAPGAGQEAPPEPSVALPDELARVLRDYEAAWSKRDAPALARLFAEDGFVLPNGSPPVRGRQAIEKHYTGHGGPLALRAIAYAMEGRVAYIIGGYAGKAGEPDAGKFTLTLARGADGRWLIVSDMDSSNRRRQ
jgi:ketosteroid isomerase-like protein